MSIEAMKLIDPHDHPEPHTMKWTQLEMDYINKRVETAVRQAIEQAQKQIPPSAYSNTHQPEQAQKDHTYGYAKHLAETIFKLHFASDEHYASGRIVWGVNDTVIGILTQIDNMVADMVRKSEQAQPEANERSEVEPVAYVGKSQFERLMRCGLVTTSLTVHKAFPDDIALHTSPPQRQPLTDEQIKAVIATIDPSEQYLPAALRQFARAIEAKIKGEA